MYRILRLNRAILFLLCFFALFKANSESVKFIFTSEKTVENVFLFPGRISLLHLPCPITKALVGSPNDIKAEVDKLNQTEAHLLLKKWSSEPSNLILKCNQEVFLFSLIPSKKSHYDYIKVLSHIASKPLKVKFPSPNTPSPNDGGLRGEDFTIRKILDFSWEDR
ncbi:MAG: hypothetical protein OXK80_05685 [Bdellovibrionales bacterium]|nr:hypothetical protein [Bdellovibrionales bacterium]